MPSKEEHYLGNPLLKRANINVELTQEQLLELIRCSEDPIYFAKKYIKIVTLDEGLVSFEPYSFQEDMLKNFHNKRFNICKLPRQCGKCLIQNTKIKARNKITGKVVELEIGELYETIKKENCTDLP